VLNIESQAELNQHCLDCLYTAFMSIGARIRQLREANKLSGEKFGELCGVTKGAVSQWESDDVTPPIDQLIKIKQHLNFSIDYIYTGEKNIANQIAESLSIKERQAWYRVGRSFAEPDEGTNGK
jgi:transcriptional regulator with XRE-family HTH domain